MAYVGSMTGTYYGPQRAPVASYNQPRGGATGVERDFGLRDKYADLAGQWELGNQSNKSQWDLNNANNQAQWNLNAQNSYTQGQNIGAQGRNAVVGQAAGMLTEGMKRSAIGELRPAQDRWRRQADEGMYSDAEIAQQLVARTARVNQAADASRSNFNAMMQQRGLGANAGAIASMGMAADWEAAGQRGDAQSQLTREDKEAMERGLQGYSGISQSIADYQGRPTQESALSLLGKISNGSASGPQSPYQGSGAYGQSPLANPFLAQYDQWRNAAIGPGSGLGDAPHPIRPTYNSGFAQPGTTGPIRPIKPIKPITWRGR